MLAQARELLRAPRRARRRAARSRRSAARWRRCRCIRGSRTCCSPRARCARVPLAAELAALLSERDLLRRGGARARPRRAHAARAAAARVGARRRSIAAALQRVRRSAAQSAAAWPARGVQGGGAQAAAPIPAPRHAALAGLLLALAFPDRIAPAPRRGGAGGYLLANGRGAAFPRPTGARARRNSSSRSSSTTASARRASTWPRRSRARTSSELLRRRRSSRATKCDWDARAEAVAGAAHARARRAAARGAATAASVAGERAAAAMLEGVRQLGIAALPWDDETRNLQARLRIRAAALDRRAAADLAGERRRRAAGRRSIDWLAPWLEGMTRRDQLARVPLARGAARAADARAAPALDELAPRTARVPTGSRIRIDYDDDGGPCAVGAHAGSVRPRRDAAHRRRHGAGDVQAALAGAAAGAGHARPRELLAERSYAEVRKDMRGRYPRHHWPEDPLTAAPTRGAKRRALSAQGRRSMRSHRTRAAGVVQFQQNTQAGQAMAAISMAGCAPGRHARRCCCWSPVSGQPAGSRRRPAPPHCVDRRWHGCGAGRRATRASSAARVLERRVVSLLPADQGHGVHAAGFHRAQPAVRCRVSRRRRCGRAEVGRAPAGAGLPVAAGAGRRRVARRSAFPAA